MPCVSYACDTCALFKLWAICTVKKQDKNHALAGSDLSRRSWTFVTTGPSGSSAANYVAVDGPPGPSMAAMDGPLCRKWSPTSKPAQGG